MLADIVTDCKGKIEQLTENQLEAKIKNLSVTVPVSLNSNSNPEKF